MAKALALDRPDVDQRAGAAQVFFGAGRAANFLYLVPVIATILAIGLSGEIPGLWTILGGGIAIAGVVVVNLWGRD